MVWVWSRIALPLPSSVENFLTLVRFVLSLIWEMTNFLAKQSTRDDALNAKGRLIQKSKLAGKRWLALFSILSEIACFFVPSVGLDLAHNWNQSQVCHETTANSFPHVSFTGSLLNQWQQGTSKAWKTKDRQIGASFLGAEQVYHYYSRILL